MSTDSLEHKQFMAKMRKERTRAKIHGTADKPRLSVHLSNRNISAQIINDDLGRTLAYASTLTHKSDSKVPLSEDASWLGTEIAKKGKAAKVKTVVFDRGGQKYHGRIQKLAEAARAAGLEF